MAQCMCRYIECMPDSAFFKSKCNVQHTCTHALEIIMFVLHRLCFGPGGARPVGHVANTVCFALRVI